MQNFNENWSFKLQRDSEWTNVTLPHDWLIFDAKNLYKSGVGEYRKHFDVSGFSKNKSYKLRFDGVYMDTTVYVNGFLAFEWKNGYTAFWFEIGEFLKEGKNEVRVLVNYKSPNSRWYSGAGIYRDTWFIEESAEHFVQDGINITPVCKNGEWRVYVEAEFSNAGVIKDTRYKVNHEILDTDYTAMPDGSLKITTPILWTLESPHLYTLKSTILYSGETINEKHTTFGIRTIEFTPNDGFLLNGKRTKINGVCQHHDLGIFGAKVHKDALKRQLMILKDMGANAIRTAHNPPARAFMELADEMGFLVMSEFTDMWKHAKTEYDYARFFEDWVERDVAAWIKRDRNSPSIIMWSIGNEIPDTHVSYEEGSETMKKLIALVKEHDPQEHARITLCSNYMPWENTQKCADIIKLIGYNYAEYLYENHHKAHPDWIIYGGETSSVVSSRGVYHFPLKRSTLANDDMQCSALGNSATSWGAKSTLHCIYDHEEMDFTLGQFIWSGFDYIGEPTPYHTKNSYFGQIDTAGFPKDSYYMFKAAWTQEPVLHLFPYWDFSPGQEVDVRVVTNAVEVELFVNGISRGRKKVGKKLVADYVVRYEPGEIRAVAYARKSDNNFHDNVVKCKPEEAIYAQKSELELSSTALSNKSARNAPTSNGECLVAVCEVSRRSFGDTCTLQLTKKTVGELDFTEITALDEKGNPVENACDRVVVKVRGGVLYGLDNGDSTDCENYQSNTRRLFSGKLLAVSKGGVLSAEIDKTDIPVRKIELLLNGLDVTAKIFPPNATHRDISWRLTNEAGIDNPHARLEVAPIMATIIPKADGEVYVRCMAANGKEHPSIISLMKVRLEGYGVPYLNPYEFVSGGLYTLSNAPMTNGNERGVATLREMESHVGFENLDFGSFGSNEFTIGLFPLTHEPFEFEVWEGMPPEGEKLATFTYDKGSTWNTYIDVVYKLPRKIKGITTLAFKFDLKCHIKGFTFAKM